MAASRTTCASVSLSSPVRARRNAAGFASGPPRGPPPKTPGPGACAADVDAAKAEKRMGMSALALYIACLQLCRVSRSTRFTNARIGITAENGAPLAASPGQQYEVELAPSPAWPENGADTAHPFMSLLKEASWPAPY